MAPNMATIKDKPFAFQLYVVFFQILLNFHLNKAMHQWISLMTSKEKEIRHRRWARAHWQQDSGHKVYLGFACLITWLTSKKCFILCMNIFSTFQRWSMPINTKNYSVLKRNVSATSYSTQKQQNVLLHLCQPAKPTIINQALLCRKWFLPGRKKTKYFNARQLQ